MRFTSIVLASAAFFASSDLVLAAKEKVHGERPKTLLKDDQIYWNRVLAKGYPAESSMPTPPPTPRPTPATPAPTPATPAPTPATPAPTPATPVPTPATPAPTPATPAPTPATPAPTPATPAPTPATPPPTAQASGFPSSTPSDVPSSVPLTPAPTPVSAPPTIQPPNAEPSDTCFAQVAVECVPPVNPDSLNGDRFEDCDSINIVPAECLEFVSRFTFRFTGGDCSNSNNIQNPLLFSCTDYFGGPPPLGDVGAESTLYIVDIKGQGITYWGGPVLVDEVFNITNIEPAQFIIANVNATFYAGERSPANIRQTMTIHTSCSQVTFLKDRYGALELIGFENPSQGYVSCLVPVFFNFNIQNTAAGFNAVVQSLISITNFGPPNDVLNFTSAVAGTALGPGEEVPLSSDPIDIDLSVRKLYTVFTTVQGISPEGYSCRGSDFTNFTAGTPDITPISSKNPAFTPPVNAPSSAPARRV